MKTYKIKIQEIEYSFIWFNYFEDKNFGYQYVNIECPPINEVSYCIQFTIENGLIISDTMARYNSNNDWDCICEGWKDLESYATESEVLQIRNIIKDIYNDLMND